MRDSGRYACKARTPGDGFSDAKVTLAFGSDFPVEIVNPFWGIYAGITRQDAEGKPPGGWHPEQKLSLAETLRGFTAGAAYAGFAEERLGLVKAGLSRRSHHRPPRFVRGRPGERTCQPRGDDSGGWHGRIRASPDECVPGPRLSRENREWAAGVEPGHAELGRAT